MLEALTVRRSDGRQVSLGELPLAQLLNKGETLRAEELELSVPDGRSVSVLVNVTPMRSEDGEVKSAVVTVQDMTPLGELERLRAEFLAMVSHELRGPSDFHQRLGHDAAESSRPAEPHRDETVS